MNVSKSSKPFLVTLLLITIVGIPLTLYSLQKTQIFQNFAWYTEQSASTMCSTDNGNAVIDVSFSNTETDKDMNVKANDLQTGTFVDLGTIKAHNTKKAEIDTMKNSIKSGSVIFKLTWSDGSSGTDTRSATYPAVNNCPAPPNFCPVSGQDNQGLCKWTPLAGAKGYKVVVTETDTNAVVLTTSASADASQIGFPMTPGKPYQCNVSPTNECGTGTPVASTPVVCPVPSIIPSPSPLPSPSGPVCPSGTSTQGVCHWDAVSGATSYSIVVQDITTGQNVTATVQAPSTEFSFADNGVDTYQCNVIVTNVCGNSPPANSPPSTCTGPTPSIVISPTPTTPATPTPSPTPTPTPLPTATPTPTPLPTATPKPTPTSIPLPTPTPVVIVRTITSPPQQTQTTVQTPGQTNTIVQQVPGQTQTVVQQQPVVQQVVRTQVPTTPGPTMAPTGNTTPTYVLIGTSALLLLAGGLIFFIL